MSSVKIYHVSEAEAASNEAVTLTQVAVDHLKLMLAKRGAGLGMRLSVKRTGCSGYGYVVDFIDEIQSDDHVFPLQDELVVVVDPKSLTLIKGTQIDFSRQGLNEMFSYSNPNQSGECGCGESFSVEE